MPKPEQEEMPIEGEGVSVKRIKKLDDAIAEWRDVVEKRMKLTEKETEAKANVVQVMLEKEVKVYRYDDDHNIRIKDGIKWEKIKAAAANGSDD